MIGGVVSMGRSLAEAIMSEQVRVGSETETVSTQTLAVSHTLAVAYTGAARVLIRGNQQTDERVSASQIADLNRAVISLPVAAAVKPGMILIVDGSTADQQLVGRRFRLIGEATAGQVTARRFDAEVLSA